MYRIYINETVLIIDEKVPPNTDNSQAIDIHEFSFKPFYEKAMAGTISGVFLLLTPKPKGLFKKIKKKFYVIRAAGGLVRNEENKYLFIFRNGKWDLPKGKVDPGEKTKRTAVREVQEECGIVVDELKDRICKTWHAYELNGQQILKRTSWYHMRAYKQKKLTPQKSEGITMAKWVAPGDLEKLKSNTYPLIRDIMQLIV